MGTALVIIKIMPGSPATKLDPIKEKAQQIAEKNGGKNISMKIEPIAFGLNSILLNFAIDESNEIDPIENSLKKIKGVSSAEVIDFRRAFG